MFPDLSKLGDLAKEAELAKKRSVEQHQETVKLLTEIRDGIRELIKQLKGD